MIPLTKTQIDNFTVANINSRTFLIFAKLVNLSNATNFKKIIELLYYRKIDLFTLAGLPIIDDMSIQGILYAYAIKSEATTLYTPNAGSFSGYTYLEGMYNANSYNIMTEHMSNFRSYQNSVYGLNELLPVLQPLRIRIGRNSAVSYDSIGTFITDFNTNVLPRVLIAFEGVANIRSKFPLLVTPTNVVNPASIQSKYNSLFGDFINNIDNTNLYKLVITIDGQETSSFEKFIVKFHELNNFVKYAHNIQQIHEFHTFELTSLGREYTTSELNAQLAYIYNYLFSDMKVSESFAQVYYRAKLYSLCKAYATGSTTYFNPYINDLDMLMTYIASFKKLLDVLYLNIQNSIKLIR